MVDLPTENKVEAMLEHITSLAKERLEKEKPFYAVTAYDIGESMVIVQCNDMMQFPQSRRMLSQLLASYVESKKAGIAMLVSEAYMLEMQVEKGEEPEIPSGSLAVHPERVEALMFNIFTPDGQTLTIYPIDRENKQLGERRDLDEGEIDGNLKVRGHGNR